MASGAASGSEVDDRLLDMETGIMAFNKLVDSFESDGGPSLSMVDAGTRVAFLKKVYGWTFVGLLMAAATAMAMVVLIAQNPSFWLAGYMPLVVMIGCYFVAHFLCAGIVSKPGSGFMGLAIANVAEGLAIGYLLFYAIRISEATTGEPYALIAQALGLTVLTVFGVTAYVWTNPSEFRWAQAIVSALFLPMIILMVVGVFAPGLFGGTFGIILSIVFIGVSVLGVLLSTRDVLYNLSEHQVWIGAYLLSMGILILFWNILQLLMRLQSRD